MNKETSAEGELPQETYQVGLTLGEVSQICRKGERKQERHRRPTPDLLIDDSHLSDARHRRHSNSPGE